MRAQGSGDNSSSCRTDLSQHGWLCTWPKRILSTSRSTAVLWSDEDKRGGGGWRREEAQQHRIVHSAARQEKSDLSHRLLLSHYTVHLPHLFLPLSLPVSLSLTHTQKAAGLRIRPCLTLEGVLTLLLEHRHNICP